MNKKELTEVFKALYWDWSDLVDHGKLNFRKGDWLIELSALNHQPRFFNASIFKLREHPSSDTFIGVRSDSKEAKWTNAYCVKLPINISNKLDELLQISSVKKEELTKIQSEK